MFAADVHGLFLDYLYCPDSDDSREQFEFVHDKFRLAGEFPVNQFFLANCDQITALYAGVDVVYFPVYVHASDPSEVQARFRGGDDCRDGLPDHSVVLYSFSDRHEFLQCHIWYAGCLAVVAGGVAVKLECCVVGYGIVLYSPKQALHVQERIVRGYGLDGDIGMCAEGHEVCG